MARGRGRGRAAAANRGWFDRLTTGDAEAAEVLGKPQRHEGTERCERLRRDSVQRQGGFPIGIVLVIVIVIEWANGARERTREGGCSEPRMVRQAHHR